MWDFQNLGGIITNNARRKSEIKSRIAVAKAAFQQAEEYFINKLKLNLRKKLEKCCIWSNTAKNRS